MKAYIRPVFFSFGSMNNVSFSRLFSSFYCFTQISFATHWTCRISNLLIRPVNIYQDIRRRVVFFTISYYLAFIYAANPVCISQFGAAPRCGTGHCITIRNLQFELYRIVHHYENAYQKNLVFLYCSELPALVKSNVPTVGCGLAPIGIAIYEVLCDHS